MSVEVVVGEIGKIYNICFCYGMFGGGDGIVDVDIFKVFVEWMDIVFVVGCFGLELLCYLI